MAATLTIHQGGKTPESQAKLFRGALSALLDLADTLEPDDYLLPAIRGLIRCCDYRLGKLGRRRDG